MKKLLLIATLGLIISGSQTATAGSWANNVTKSSTNFVDLTTNRKVAYTVSDEFARAGNVSQKFVLEHGHCGRDQWYSDCKNDAQRVERFAKHQTLKTWYYSYSIYLPDTWQSVAPATQVFGQVKARNVGMPVWIVKMRDSQFAIDIHWPDSGSTTCVLGNEQSMIGKWTDIVVKADYSSKIKPDNTYLEVWINNKSLCKINEPILPKSAWKNRFGSDHRKEVSFRYGVYNFDVSKWLNEHKTKLPTNLKSYKQSDAQTGDLTKFKPAESISQSPFEHDWGVELPTRVVYYDEIKIGNTLESVQINQNKPVD